MSRRIALTHTIEQRFAHPIRLSTHWLRLRPATHARARVTAYSLRVDGAPHFLNWVRDAFENHVARLDLPEPVGRLAIEVALVAELTDANPLDFLVEPAFAECPFAYDEQLRKELAPYLHVDRLRPEHAAWLDAHARARAYVLDRLRAVTIAVHEHATGTPTELTRLLVTSFRMLGIAARFTSGYRIAGEAARLHAWSEVYLPGAGWIGLDPTDGLFATDAYVPLACTPDPLRALPITGFREACDETTREEVVVQVLAPEPPAWPLDDDAWAAVRALGACVDADLDAGQTQLAVGRELAFVSSRDAGRPEWSTVALGDGKRQAADALVEALRARMAPGGVVQVSLGDSYAGEPVPRWRLACVYRRDGAPLWRNLPVAACGDATAPGPDAARFGSALASVLGVAAEDVVPAWDDPLPRLLRDGGSAIAIAPPPELLRDPVRRRELADRLSAQGCRAPAGWVLPLAWDAASERWRSERWRFRRDRLYLLEGTLPVGLRLPLEGLPATTRGAADRPTALCLEVREGRLHVFLPPTDSGLRWGELVAAVDAAAARHPVPLVLEGYEPPDDAPGLARFILEPDAGVLRVRVPAVAGFAAQTDLLHTVHAEAAVLGLHPERRTASGESEPIGAGTAIVLEGTTPDESPLLRRPEILRGLVAHWQRHPCLSYFFATRFVGPSGRAPRPDEGRDDALHELDLALARVPRGESSVPWLPDRLLRHVLADPTGDMRRAELCIDALFDPANAHRRLGRLVVRSFDTPPHERLAALQSLLVTALVARFARDPRPVAIRPWGPALADQFFLPTVLWHDLQAVLSDLDAAGYPLQAQWFAPFLALHFPCFGRVQVGDVALELRRAHEPWPVLAEESTSAGVARFLDVANARVEVRATGLTPSRHLLTCNGRRVPLRPTGTVGEAVAGIRFKASCPAATLHPTTPAVSALVVDLVDGWTGQAIGGFQFFPAAGTPAGPVAAPSPLDDGVPGHGGRPLPAPSPLVGARPQSGRFVPAGSGRVPVDALPEEPVTGYVLDLT